MIGEETGHEALAVQRRTEKEARRSLVLTEWKKTSSPPQNKEVCYEMRLSVKEMKLLTFYCPLK